MLDMIDYQMGGTEKQILMILKHIDREKYDIHLCFFRYSKWMEDNAEEYKIFYFDFSSFMRPRSYLAFISFVKYLRRQQFDILVSFFKDSNKIAVPAAKLSGIKNIVFSRRNSNHWVTKKEEFILKVLRPFVTSYWVNAKDIKNRLVIQEHVSQEKVEVIYNGFVLNERVSANKCELLKGIPQSKIVTNVSNLREVKGLDVFIRAAAAVINEYSDVHFVIVGEGDKRTSLERLIKKLNIDSQVSLVGKQTDVNAILKGSDVGVLSSHSEGLSNAIIEYMASALPVVCTDVGGAAEMVAEGENGFLVPDKDHLMMAKQILRLLEDDEMRKIYGDVSREKAFAMFQCQVMIKHLGDYFTRLAGM